MSQPYQQNPGALPVEYPQGTAILVTGILSLVCCGPIGLYAWIKGNEAIREIDANPTAYSNRSMVQIGRILGIVGFILSVAIVLFYVVFFVIFAASNSA